MPRLSPEAPILYTTQIAHGRLKNKKGKRHYSHSQGVYNLIGKLKKKQTNNREQCQTQLNHEEQKLTDIKYSGEPEISIKEQPVQEREGIPDEGNIIGKGWACERGSCRTEGPHAQGCAGTCVWQTPASTRVGKKPVLLNSHHQPSPPTLIPSFPTSQSSKLLLYRSRLMSKVRGAGPLVVNILPRSELSLQRVCSP